MARRASFSGLISAIARDAARAQRAAQVQKRRRIREAEAAEHRAIRETERLTIREEKRIDIEKKKTRAQEEKEARQQYIADRIEEVNELNNNLDAQLQDLCYVLEHTLDLDDTISFESLRIKDKYPPFKPPQDCMRTSIKKPDRESFVSNIPKLSVFSKMLPGAQKKYEMNLQQAEQEYQSELERWEICEKDRITRLEKLNKEYDNNKRSHELKKEQRNAEVLAFEKAYQAGDPEAIITYNNMVLERSEYPEDFPQEFRIAYTPESKQIVIEYQLPTVDVVPKIVEYNYAKTKDKIIEKQRKTNEIKEIYQDLIAAIALRTIHEVIEADQCMHLDVVCFNGFIQTIDRSTGQDIRPHLISIRTTRDRFGEINLSKIDKKACLRNLGAQISPRPSEAQAVKPVIEFDMADRRFVDQSDVLTDLESRPNLMDLNPFEFENLVANLFEQMGLESKLTRSSRDGGVDCVAFDPRPVLGGKVVIQAKRYRNTVGVSAVRDLYGTMMNEGANKGILVSTSGYGPDAFDFCKDKPIELIDGGGLLYLLQQIGINARIIYPEE